MEKDLFFALVWIDVEFFSRVGLHDIVFCFAYNFFFFYVLVLSFF